MTKMEGIMHLAYAIGSVYDVSKGAVMHNIYLFGIYNILTNEDEGLRNYNYEMDEL